MWGTICLVTQNHVPEDVKVHQHCCALCVPQTSQHQYFMRPCTRPSHCGICICSCCFYIITHHYARTLVYHPEWGKPILPQYWWAEWFGGFLKLWVFTKFGVGPKGHRYSHLQYCKAQLVKVDVVKSLYNFFSPFLVFNVERCARIMCEHHLVACAWGWVPLAMLHKMVGQLLVVHTEVLCVMTWSK